MPTWAYRHRDITDVHGYTIARHLEIMTSWITALDLKRVTLVCQDWGGPIGLALAVLMPERFDRLIVMNTWLHHPECEYRNAIRTWNRNGHEGALFHRPRPDVALLMVASAGLAGPDVGFHR